MQTPPRAPQPHLEGRVVDAPTAADTVGAGAASQHLVKLAGGDERLCGVAAAHQAPADVNVRHGALPAGLPQLLVQGRPRG